jgi:hypothetical protein
VDSGVIAGVLRKHGRFSDRGTNKKVLTAWDAMSMVPI